MFTSAAGERAAPADVVLEKCSWPRRRPGLAVVLQAERTALNYIAVEICGLEEQVKAGSRKRDPAFTWMKSGYMFT